MSFVALSPTSDALRRPQTSSRDEEASIGRGERHELEPLHTRNDAYSITHNDQTDGGTNRSASIETNGGTDWCQVIHEDEEELISFVHRFTGHGRWVPWSISVANIVRSSVLNFLIIFIPLAWGSHFADWNGHYTFYLCFVSIIPLAKLFDFGGEQMEFYLGRDLGDLVVITLNNAVEATLAIILLHQCRLKTLQSTITGVVVLHLLLIPGTAFLTGGARIWEQNLHPHPTQLNHSLLTVGVLTIMIPTAFFAALDRGESEPGTEGLISDLTRGEILMMSRGLAIILLVIYIGSRIYLHNPPGEDTAQRVAQIAPAALKEHDRELVIGRPQVNVWACIIMLAVTITIMAVTAVFMVESMEHVQVEAHIRLSWFGVILLPLVSFAADGALATLFFVRYALRLFFGTPPPPAELAKGRAIDLSIQFLLFWLPFLVLLGWWTGKPIHMLFDYYEVALLLGACFLVNYITADSKTNWVEGLIMVSFYMMISLVTWWYPGQQSSVFMLRCLSVLTPDAEEAEEGGGEVAEVAVRMAVRAAAQMIK